MPDNNDTPPSASARAKSFVLIIHRDIAVRQDMVLAIQDQGYRCIGVPDEAEALKLLKRTPRAACLILLDLSDVNPVDALLVLASLQKVEHINASGDMVASCPLVLSMEGEKPEPSPDVMAVIRAHCYKGVR